MSTDTDERRTETTIPAAESTPEFDANVKAITEDVRQHYAPTQTTIRDGWRFWLAVAFLAPIAFWIWLKEKISGR